MKKNLKVFYWYREEMHVIIGGFNTLTVAEQKYRNLCQPAFLISFIHHEW